MPSSTYDNLTPFVKEILKMQPKSILDIGIGFGKWGFLAREYLETWNDRVYPEQWKVRLEGIEIHKPYVDKFTWLQTIYNKIYVGDASIIINELDNYDMITAGDVVEHLPKKKGIDLVIKGIEKSKCFILSIPIGKAWMNNKVVGGNENEAHKAVWEIEDILNIDKLFPTRELHTITWKGNANRTGVIAIWKRR